MSDFGPGEAQNTEFKRSLQLRKEAFAALCAMVNAESAHGTVVFGVEDDGTVVGLDDNTDLDTAQRNLANHCAQKIDPPLALELRASTVDGKQVLSMSARRAISVAFHEYGGRAYLRVGTSSRVLTLGEKQRLLAEREVQRALALA